MRVAFLALLTLLLAAPASAQGDSLLVVIVDPGPTQINQPALIRAISEEVERTTIRLTDERAQGPVGRLTIAFSRPDRWVLRYESAGQVAWVSDRIRDPRELRTRLARLSRDVVVRVDGSVGSAQAGGANHHGHDHHTTITAPQHRGTWNEDVILALQDEIVDPFANDPPRPRPRPVTVLWSEVVDPFTDRAPRASIREVWSEVLDPWSTEVRRQRR